MAKKTKKWFNPSGSLNWRKTDSQTKRRKAALAAKKGNALTTARALQSLANVTTDTETRRKASSDAKYFYLLHRKRNKGK